jgi:phage shock protein C
MKRLVRSSTDKKIAGVMGGIGNYFDTDPSLIRVLFLFSTLVSGLVPGIITYVIAVVLIPEEGAPVIHEVHEETRTGSDTA